MTTKKTPKTTCLTPAAFLKLPQKQKAMLVIEDVLAQVRGEKYRIENQTYLNFNPERFKGMDKSSTASPEGSKAILNARCECCARGAIFLSAIRLSNRMSIKELVDLEQLTEADDAQENWLDVMEATTNALATKVCDKDGVFTKKQFTLIEVAFEGDVMPFVKSRNKPTVKSIEAAKEFHETFSGEERRWTCKSNAQLLISAICLNILANGGLFCPGKNDPTIEEANKAIQIEVAP